MWIFPSRKWGYFKACYNTCCWVFCWSKNLRIFLYRMKIEIHSYKKVSVPIFVNEVRFRHNTCSSFQSKHTNLISIHVQFQKFYSHHHKHEFLSHHKNGKNVIILKCQATEKNHRANECVLNIWATHEMCLVCFACVWESIFCRIHRLVILQSNTRAIIQ